MPSISLLTAPRYPFAPYHGLLGCVCWCKSCSHTVCYTPSSALETCLPARFVRSDNPFGPLCSRSLSFGTNAALKRPGLPRLDFIPLKTNVDSEVYRETIDTTERRETLQITSDFSTSNRRKVKLLLNTSRGRGILWSSSQSVFVVLGCAIPTSPCIDKS